MAMGKAERPPSKRAKNPKKFRSATAGKRTNRKSARDSSKQAKVLELLSRPEGITVTATMKSTGWQQHSVRGFFAGIVRKKLGLTLESKKSDAGRIYRIVPDGKKRPKSKTFSSNEKSSR
jgi:hypothetical protein